MSLIPIFSLGGAFGDVTEDETAFGGGRATRFMVNVTATTPDSESVVTSRAWVRSVWRALVPSSGESGGDVTVMAHRHENARQATTVQRSTSG